MASHSDNIYVAVVGVGGVGQNVLAQLSKIQSQYPNLHIVLIASSRKSLYVPDPSNSTFYPPLSLSSWQPDLKSSCQSPLSPSEISDYLYEQCTGGKATILIDNTSSQDMVSIYPSCLEAGISIVTPNKKAFSGPLAFWKDIFAKANSPTNSKGGYLYHESTVGAGLPIISTLNDLVATGDRVTRIEGVFSGTMSFLFNNFAPVGGQGGKWSDEVKKAKEAGFTEPDPRDDLNGVDVARKLVILARIAGLEVEGIEAFSVESLIPEQLREVRSGEEFLERLGEFDGEMKEVKERAGREGKVVRFVGSIDVGEGKLKVGLELLEKGHPIAGLKGSDNIVSFYTERYGANPLVVQGAGAGGAVTAMGVTSDLLKVLRQIS